MESIKTIESVLENMDRSIVYKTKKSIGSGLILSLVGVITFSMHSVREWPANSIISPLLIIMGSVMVVLGIINTLYRKSYFVSSQSKQKLKAYDIKFNITEQKEVVRLLESGKLTDLRNVQKSNCEALKLTVISTKDGKLCFSQLIAYEHNEFRYITEPKHHSEVEAENLLSLK
jgi:hypothetical protein